MSRANTSNTVVNGGHSPPFDLNFIHEPAQKDLPHQSGAILEPHLVVRLSGYVKDHVRYTAFIYSNDSSRPLRHGHRGGEEVERQDGIDGFVILKFDKLQVETPGTYRLLVTVAEAAADSTDLPVCAEGQSAEFRVV